MTKVGLLLQEQIQSSLPPFFRNKSGKSYMFGTILTLLLGAGIIAIFVLLFGRFVETYTSVKINRISDIASRQYEILSLSYFILMVICTIMGIVGISRSLFEDTNLPIIASMPFVWELII